MLYMVGTEAICWEAFEFDVATAPVANGVNAEVGGPCILETPFEFPAKFILKGIKFVD
jgi:hypothetical protein